MPSRQLSPPKRLLSTFKRLRRQQKNYQVKFLQSAVRSGNRPIYRNRQSLSCLNPGTRPRPYCSRPKDRRRAPTNHDNRGSKKPFGPQRDHRGSMSRRNRELGGANADGNRRDQWLNLEHSACNTGSDQRHPWYRRYHRLGERSYDAHRRDS